LGPSAHGERDTPLRDFVESAFDITLFDMMRDKCGYHKGFAMPEGSAASRERTESPLLNESMSFWTCIVRRTMYK